MQTIPLGSRTIGAHSAPTFAISTQALTSPHEPDDLTLIAATQCYLAGLGRNPTANPTQGRVWHEFYCRYRPTVARLARSGTRDSWVTPVADAEQEVWTALVERLGTFRVDASLGSFAGWLGTVAQRRLADDRRARRRRPVPRIWDEPPVDLVSPEADPAEECERAEEHILLANLLERLRVEVTPTNYRILHLRSIEERPADEVGNLLGLSPGQVRDRHYRMMARLRELARTRPVAHAPKNFAKSPRNHPIPGYLVTCM